ncbi:MAG: BamA/TamA family outer membrane protein [Chitinophagaceae bacterium]|jgi:outer membrane protein assembly factor BamA
MKKTLVHFVLIALLLLLPVFGAMAQQWQITGHRIDNTKDDISAGISNKYNSAQELSIQLRKIIPNFHQEGYLAASIDSIAINGSQYDVYYFLGEKYYWANLLFDSIPAPLLLAASINPKQFSGRPLNPKTIANLSEKLLSYCDENGYPFAKVWLSDIVETEPNKISARFRIDRAELRKIDTLIVNGDVTISQAFLLRYLDIAQGSVYNEKKLGMISQRIRELPFVEEASPWTITFRPGDTRLAIHLKEKKANQLNALLGLMPNNLQTGKLFVTADVQIALLNKLGNGESISASYQNLQPKSPRIKADVVVPYLFKSPIGAEAHFDLFTNNLQFRKVSLQAGIRYQLSSADYVRLYYQTLSNRVIEIDSASILATHQLPANIDTRSNGVGFELVNNRTDYKLNPHKGWQAKMGIAAFQRKILINNAISGLSDGSGFDFASLYDTITKKTYQYHLSADIAGFIPLGKNLTLKMGYVGGYIAAPRIFQNELFQIGGFRLLRGFDEQSIFANQYHISVTELRVKFTQNSYAYLFSDNGWVQTKFNAYNRQSFYNGFGLGTTLETKTGLFSIALAFGRSDFIPLRFRESKISFGYVALF